MLNPAVRLDVVGRTLVADFWDSLRLDPAPIRDLRQKYEARVGLGEGPDLVVDFTGVTFAGSAALSGFVTLQKSCRKAGGRLVFCEAEPPIVESLRLSRLLPLFTLIARREDALATLAGSGLEPFPVKAAPAEKARPLATPPIRTRRRRG